MPSEYRCRDCALVFQIGWYHHFPQQSPSGYHSANLGVCKACGTQHEIEFAFNDGDVSEWLEYYEVWLTGLPEEKRVAVMAELRRSSQVGLRECREAVRALPMLLEGDVFRERAEELESLYARLGARTGTVLTRRERNPHYAPPRKDRLKWLRQGPAKESIDFGGRSGWQLRDLERAAIGSNGEILTEHLPCGHCGVAALIFEDGKPFPCPVCGHTTPEMVDAWVT